MNGTISRYIAVMAVCLALAAAGARAEDVDVYTVPPVYTDAMQLADAVHLAELVVAGRLEVGDADSARLVVDEVLFGRMVEVLRDDDEAIRLMPPVRGEDGDTGVFLLVRLRDGYVMVAPGAVTRADYEHAARGVVHWTAQPGLGPTVWETQVYHTYHDELLGRPIWHGTNARRSGASSIVELLSHGERVFVAQWDDAGHPMRIHRVAPRGHGFTLDYKKGRLTGFRHYRDGRDHGVARKYFPARPDQIREERHYDDGVLHGRLRTWGLDGELVRDVMIDRGLEPPIVRYERDEADVEPDVEAGDPPRLGVTKFVRRDDVQYQCFDRAVVESIEVGMTAEEVAAILKVDFSLKTGVRFPMWTIDTYLHIKFEDRRVSEVRTGHNGVCVDVAE